jgi:hypothetical protein
LVEGSIVALVEVVVLRGDVVGVLFLVVVLVRVIVHDVVERMNCSGWRCDGIAVYAVASVCCVLMAATERTVFN